MSLLSALLFMAIDYHQRKPSLLELKDFNYGMNESRLVRYGDIITLWNENSSHYIMDNNTEFVG